MCVGGGGRVLMVFDDKIVLHLKIRGSQIDVTWYIEIFALKTEVSME